jgi:hypothetical protein
MTGADIVSNRLQVAIDRPDEPSCSDAQGLDRIVRVLKESGHFCFAADWVVIELSQDILLAIKPHRNS